ncbi:MAG: hypothetical protein R3B69_02800 [Candidatus Paceibacterota bacterium]
MALLNTDEQERAQQYFIWASAEAQQLTVNDWGSHIRAIIQPSGSVVWQNFKKQLKKNLELVSN